MRANSKSKRKNRRARRKQASQNYGTLEDRNLLATLVDLGSSGDQLSVTMTADSDVAVIGIATNGNVTVNGNEDLNSSKAGTQTLAASNLYHIDVFGDETKTDQHVSFNGRFSGDNTLLSVDVDDVGMVTINGELRVRGDVEIKMSGEGGRISDARTGRLIVGGYTNIDAAGNEVVLDNADNDFNELKVKTFGNRQDAVVNEVNDVILIGLEISGNFDLTAGGDVTDAESTYIEVLGDAHFTARSVTLGDFAGDKTNFFRSGFTTSGHVNVQEDSNIVLTSSDVGSLKLRSLGGILDGLTTTINVEGKAELFGNNRIRLGEGGQDTFNAGSIEFRSNGHVHISENSDTIFTGDNKAGSLNVKSWGHVADFLDTSINVRNETGLEGISVVLGDSPDDVFNSGSLYFWTSEAFDVTEDSHSHIIETKNQAGSFRLESAGKITDADNARVTVDGLAEFKARTVNVGDTRDDWFVAGAMNFDTVGQFKITENSHLNIVGENSAANTVINSTGNISNAVDAKVHVRNVASFFADNIVLGTRSGDEFNAGTINFRTADSANGLVQINEDSATNVGGISTAKTLKILSSGDITDSPSSDLSVVNNSQLMTTATRGRIVMGDSGVMRDGTPFDATFDTRTLTVQSDGNSVIEEDGDIILTGANRANSMSLISKAENGRILDTQETQIDIRFNLSVDGDLVNLGTGIIPNGSSTDRLEFSSLTFKSSGNVKVSADDSFFLTGSSETGGFLTLESEGNIQSTAGSELVSTAGAQFDGMDILVGHLADDCFDIINSNADGSKRLLVNGNGTEDVQLGCNI